MGNVSLWVRNFVEISNFEKKVGKVIAGTVKVGQKIMIAPHMIESTVLSIEIDHVLVDFAGS